MKRKAKVLKSSRRRGRLVLFLLLVLLGFSFVRLPLWSRGLIAGRLASFFHRPCSVGEVRYHLFPFEIEVKEVRVAGLAEGAPPFLEVPRIVLAPSLAPLWERRVVLSRMRIQGPRIRIHAFPEGGDDIPRMGGGGKGGAEVLIRRLSIEGGEFFLNHERVPLNLDLPDFSGRLGARQAGVLAGSLSFAPGRLRFGEAPELPMGSDLQVLLDGPLLTVESAHLRTERTDLAYHGQLRFGSPVRGEFQLQGAVDLDVLDRHLMRTGFGIEGAARYEGVVTVEGSRLRLKGRLEGTEGVFDAVPVPRYTSQIAWDEKGVHLRDLEVTALGGSGTLDLEIPPGKSTARLKASLREVDAEAAVMAIFDIGAAELGSSATGELSIQWPRGRIRELSGTLALDLVPREDGRTPLGGRLEWRADKGVQFVENADLRTPSTRARLQGRIETDDRTDIDVEAESADLTSADDLFMRLRRALGSPEAEVAGFAGTGGFRGRWLGTLSVPVFEGRFSGEQVGYLDVVWGSAEWAGVADPFSVRSQSLVLRRPSAELRLTGTTETGILGERDGLDIRVRFRDWPAADFIKAFEWDLDASGAVSGEATIMGRRSAPQGTAHISGREGRYYGIPYADLELISLLRGPVTQVSRGNVRVGGGTITFRGTLSDDAVYDGSAELKAIDVGELFPPIASDVRWGGRVSGQLTLQGTLQRPRLKGSLSSPRIFLGDEGVGALETALSAEGDGSVKIDALCRSPRVDLALQGTVGAEPPYRSALRLVARDTSVDPFLRNLAPAMPPLVGVVATGEASLQGPLTSPRELRVEAAVGELNVLFPEYPVRNRQPMRLVMEGGRLEVRDLEMHGEGTDLAVQGSAVLFGEGPLDLKVEGKADLRTLAVVTPRLRGRGAARLAMNVSGTAVAPAVEGRLDLEGAGLRVRGFPHGLEGVRGTVSFSRGVAHFADLTGTLGGGPVELAGQAAYAPGRLISFDVQAAGRSLGLRYPEGLRSLIDADLRFFGDAVRHWVSGSVDVRQALWTRRYDVASELLAEARSAEQSASLGGGIRYDVKLRAPGTLKVDNNLATLQARAELALQGTSDAPVLIGRAEVDRGRVYFQGNTYVIRQGAIDFANPQRIDPLFDIEAETRIRSYRVTLRVNGTLERVYPTLTSDPPLSAVQILNLLAGADESAVASLAQAQEGQARLAARGAASLAAEKLSEDIGLERGAERLGLNRFSIDPSVFRGDVTNPAARVTVGKRLSPDLNVLYSVGLGGTEERLVSVEYTLSDRLSILLTQTRPGGYGFDLRLRQSR